MSPWNAKITRVDQPEPGLLSLSFRADGRNEVLALAMLPGALGVAVVGDRPRGAGANPAVSQLRRHVEGATIRSVELSSRAARLSITRGEHTRFLVAAPSKPYGAWWVCSANGAVIVHSPGAPPAVPAEDGYLTPKSLDEARDAAAAVLDAHQSTRRAQLKQLLERHIKRLLKKRNAICQDLERAAAAEALRERASLILANASKIPADAPFFQVSNWDDEPRAVRIELDPPKSPIELAQDLFKKSKRLKRGLDVAHQRLHAVEAELAQLLRVQDELPEAALDRLAAELESQGVSITAPQEAARKRRQAGERLPYREFVSADAATVFVGRSAADNDRLTLRVARPHDLWLHARGVTGAHVVVPLTKGKSCSPETLVDAATLAAHFSDLRGENIVDVIYTPRRFVRKRRSSPLGSVALDREKVIALRLEPARLRRLLRNEKKTL